MHNRRSIPDRTGFFRWPETGWCYLSGYLLGLVYCLITIKEPFGNAGFREKIQSVMLMGITLAAGTALHLVRSKVALSVITLTLFEVFMVAAGFEDKTYSFLFGRIAVSALLIFFTHVTDPLKEGLKRISWRFVYITAGIVGLGAAAAIAIFCIEKYELGQSPCFDFGIFAQMFYNMKTYGLQLVSCERDRLLSHMAVHVSPVFYLLLPFYCLFPDPKTLLVLGAAVVFFSVFLLLRLCRKKQLSPASALVLSICFALFPGFTGGCTFYFHENNFLTLMVLWLINALEDASDRTGVNQTRAMLKCLAAAVFLLGVKEDAAVYGASIALYYLMPAIKKSIDEKKPAALLTAPSFAVLLLSVLWFFSAVYYLKNFGDGAMFGRYGNLTDGSEEGAVSIICSVLKNPANVIRQVASVEKLKFLALILLPIGLLPLCNVRCEVRQIFLLVPLILINLMSGNGYQSSVYFQYVFGTGATLFAAAVFNAAVSSRERRVRLVSFALLNGVMIYLFLFGNIFKNKYGEYKKSTNYMDELKVAQTMIPEEASVAVYDSLVANFSGHREVYSLMDTMHSAEYIVVDLRSNSDIEILPDSSTLKAIYFRNDHIVVYRNTAWYPGMLNEKGAFTEKAVSLKRELEERAKRSETGGFMFENTSVKQVWEDQHWTVPLDSMGSEAVYIVDIYGKLIYLSFRNEKYVTTWSGPTEDPKYLEEGIAWNWGKGYAWTGTKPLKE